MKLGSWLIAKGRISGAQLKRALLDQSFYGGRLSTSLIKLGYLDEATLGEYLSELFRAPYAGPSKFEQIPDEILRMVPRHLAEKHQILPLDVEGKKLQLAMMNPKDILVADEVSFLTGLQVVPWVSSEDLLLGALERYHQVRRPTRETIPMAGPAPKVPIPRVEDHLPTPVAPPPRLERSPVAQMHSEELGLDGRPLSAPSGPLSGQDWDQPGSLEALLETPSPPAVEEKLPPVAVAGRQVLSATDSPRATTTPVPSPPSAQDQEGLNKDALPSYPASRLSLEEATRRMRDSLNREDVFDALLGFGSGQLPRVALFVVMQEQVQGWSGRGEEMDLEKIRNTRLSFDVPSIFSCFRTGSDFYFGPVPELPANRKLFADLSISVPSRALLVPLHIKGRLVAVLYADSGPERGKDPEIGLFRRAAQKASLALEVLILRNKITMI